jgi:hypothetical protein
MPNMTDRGLVAIQAESDGRMTVTVSARIHQGQPRGTYAVHAHVPSVDVEPQVRLRQTQRVRYTEAIVEVFRSEDGTVHVAAIPD